MLYKPTYNWFINQLITGGAPSCKGTIEYLGKIDHTNDNTVENTKCHVGWNSLGMFGGSHMDSHNASVHNPQSTIYDKQSEKGFDITMCFVHFIIHNVLVTAHVVYLKIMFWSLLMLCSQKVPKHRSSLTASHFLWWLFRWNRPMADGEIPQK